LRAVWSRDGNPYPLLYGGSVTLQNAVELLRQQEINGLFIGRAAWDAQGYCDIVQRVTQEFILRRSNIKGHQRWKHQAMIEQDSDYALLTEIAVAYYDQEQTQEEIRQRFGISRIKVGRLLKKARQEGIVEISVKYHPVFSSRLSSSLFRTLALNAR
jgi:tRNA-dihydrouridine synthase